MLEYTLYRIGFFLSNALPLWLNYFLAKIFASLQYFLAKKDRMAVKNNIRVVTGSSKRLFRSGLEMYINFGMYLADFFRFSQLTKDYIDKNITIVGKEHLDNALKRGKGVIALTAHLGNWELGGAITGLLGYNIAAVALPHKDKRVNDFFNRQRNIKGLEVIPIGVAVRKCYKYLTDNKVVALLGDRDFSDTKFGLEVSFLGKNTRLPRGPAVLALKTGAAIVPGFVLRIKNNKFKLIFDKPIYPHTFTEKSQDAKGVGINSSTNSDISDAAVKNLMQQYVPILEHYIKKNPTQWFMFKEFWQ